MIEGALPLVEGAEGEAVADLQTRLLEAGVFPITDTKGAFGPSTRAAVESFQRQRGLRIDGIVGSMTWTTLTEAGLRLGDRLLYRAHPMQRGDDVAELQSRLCSLGFDTGRVDGIFGDQTAQALAEFQRNVQLPIDATAGLATVGELVRVSGRHQTLEPVSMVREREHLRSAEPTLRGRHIGIGEIDGLGAVGAALSRRLGAQGARVTLIHDEGESSQAQAANAAGVDVYLGLRLAGESDAWSCAWYKGYSYESTAGRDLASWIATGIQERLATPLTATGMSLVVLRETRMPAVLLEVGPAEIIVERSGVLVELLLEALACWAGPADLSPAS
jgi:N-acetylmuramoyl-L-alanine amidase